MEEFVNEASKQIELCGKVCNWVVGTLTLYALGCLLSDDYFDSELSYVIVAIILILSIIYLLIALYRHKHSATILLKGGNAMRFKNSTIWVQIVLCVCIVFLFLVSHLEVFLMAFE
jgi:uncharacterized membrane protein YidH (DUF202 family)